MKRILFQIHLWIGLILAAPFLILGATGAILVFDQDVERALNPPTVQASAGESQPLDAIAAAALNGAPKGARVNTLLLPEKPGDPAIARIGQRGQRGGGAVVEVDPVTLATHKPAPSATGDFFRMLHQLHGRFLVEGPLGRQLVGWAGAAMLVMGISGLWLWWPKRGQWARAFGVRTKGPAYRINRDLHGAFGIWTFAVFMIVTFSGVYISFPKTMAAATIAVAPGKDLRSSVDAIKASEARGEPIGFDAAAAAARAALPDGRVFSIAPAGRPGTPMRVGLRTPGAAEGAPFATIYLDPADGRVLEVRDPRRYTAGEGFQAWMRPLHEGLGVGLWFKIFAFLAGIAPMVFVVTGIAMWLIKGGVRGAQAGEPERVLVK
ncbi:MAG: PepSY-associated TM helix domain-containing protein [Hyphomonadaceae bacterium]